MATDYNEYKHEMISLHLLFRHEEAEILAEIRYLVLYDQNEAVMLEKRKEFESDLDIQKTLEICRQLCRENVPDDEEEIRTVPGRILDENPFAELYGNPDALFDKLGAIVKKKDNIMHYEEFYALMRKANEDQREILMHTMCHLVWKR